MYLVGHAAVGTFLARAVGAANPAAAFAVGLASHYVADAIPHGDEEVGDWTKRGDEVRRLFFVFSVDAVLLLAVCAAFAASHGFDPSVAAAVAGSAAPDVAWGLEKVFRRKLFGPMNGFHFRNHNRFRVRIPAWAGFVLQGIATAILWAAVFR